MNVLAVSLTIIEVMLAILAIFLGVVAFSGFWMIRREAVDAAQETAGAVAAVAAEAAAIKRVQEMIDKNEISVGTGASPQIRSAVNFSATPATGLDEAERVTSDKGQ